MGEFEGSWVPFYYLRPYPLLIPGYYETRNARHAKLLHVISWDGDRFQIGKGQENHPVVDVSWFGAAAYANFKSEMAGLEPCFSFYDWSCDFSKNGYRLPTEAEWEKAARGGLVGKRFPRGATISHDQANSPSVEGVDYDPGEPPFHPPSTDP